MLSGIDPKILESIPAGFQTDPRVSVFVGDIETKLEVIAGSVSYQSGNVQRMLQGCQVQHPEMTGREVWNLLANEAAVVKAWAGIRWRSDISAHVPMFVGRPSEAPLAVLEGSVAFTGADFGYDLAQQSFVSPLIQPATMLRRDAIKEILLGGFPGYTVITTATDDGTLGSEQAWSGTRWEAINTLCADGNMEAYFLPNETFVIRDVPDLGTPVYTFATHGDKATIKDLNRHRQLDGLKNTVTFNATATDDSQDWLKEIVTVPDDSPRSVAKLGYRNHSHDSPTIRTSAEANAAAVLLLKRLQGKAETLQITAGPGNPGLERGDTVEVAIGQIGEEPAEFLTHIIESIGSFDLRSWQQTVNTRSMVEVT